MFSIMFQLPAKDNNLAKFKIGQHVRLVLDPEKALRLMAPESGVITGVNVMDATEIERILCNGMHLPPVRPTIYKEL